MNNFKNILEGFIGKDLKNVVAKVSVGGGIERINIFKVISVGEVVEVEIESLDYRDRSVSAGCVFRLQDLMMLSYPNGE